MEKQKIVSLGNSCCVNWFFWWLGLSKLSPFDNSLYNNLSIKCLFDESFYKAVEENKFTFSPHPLIEGDENSPSNYAILKVGNGEVHWPHEVLSDKFIEHLNDRIFEFKKYIEDENSIFAITNTHDYPFSLDKVKELIDLGRFSPENLIILNRSPEKNLFSQFGFSSIDILIPHSKFFVVKKATNTRDEFEKAWEEYCKKYPKMAEKIEKVKIHDYFD